MQIVNNKLRHDIFLRAKILPVSFMYASQVYSLFILKLFNPNA